MDLTSGDAAKPETPTASATGMNLAKRGLSIRGCVGALFLLGLSCVSLLNSRQNVKLSYSTVTKDLSDGILLPPATTTTSTATTTIGNDNARMGLETSTDSGFINPDVDSNKVDNKSPGPDHTPSSESTKDATDKQNDSDGTKSKKDEPPKKMNIVLLYADDWSFNMIGAMGNKYIKTPVLDQLASEGVHFTHNCVVASVCMQSRATLYTGQYSSRHRTYMSWREVVMYETDRWKNTLYPQMMKADYHVGFFGKYHHLEPTPPGIPTFSEFKSLPYSHFFERNGKTKHVTEWNELDGLEFLDGRPRDKPFFLTISFFATHAEDGSPLQYRPMNSSMHLYADDPVPLPKTYTKKHWEELPYFINENNEGRRRFMSRYADPEMYQHHMKNTCRMVTEVDTACGNIIKRLKEQGVYDNTLIIFTTDNGNFYGQHGLAEKWYAYEESMRVPLIIRDPRMESKFVGTKNSEFTLNIDLAPTILSAANATPPDVMQGRDIAPMYLSDGETATQAWRKEFFYEFHDGNPDIMDSLALVNKEFKYIYWDALNYTQFFNLSNDPYEEFDLYNITDRSLLQQARERLDEMNKLIFTDHTF